MSGHQFSRQQAKVQPATQHTHQTEPTGSNSALAQSLVAPENELGFLDHLELECESPSWAEPVSCAEDRGSKSILYPAHDAEHAAELGCTDYANNPELQRQLDWGNENAKDYIEKLENSTPTEGGPARFPELVGTCEYYDARKADFEERNPGMQAPDYYTEYGKKYCERFSESAFEGLSGAGQEWDIRTRMNLQLALETGALDNENFGEFEKDPERMRSMAFNSHPDAYLDGGLADLPITDLGMIGMTPDITDLATVDGLKQVIETSTKMLPEVYQDTLDSVGRRELPNIINPARPASPAAASAAPGATYEEASRYANLEAGVKMLEIGKGVVTGNPGDLPDLFPGRLPAAETKDGEKEGGP